jgi:hypothetical protein
MRGISKALWDLLARSATIIAAAYYVSVIPATSYRLEEKALPDRRQHETATAKKGERWIARGGHVVSFSKDDELTMDPRRRHDDELLVNEGPGMLN